MVRKVMGAGLVLALVVSGVALGAAKAKTFSTGNISNGISGGHAISQSLTVKKKGKIKDLNVGVAFTTNENDDFTFSVMSPKGKMVQLSSENGGSGAGYGSSCSSNEITTFDDEAAQDIQDYDGVDHVFDGVSYKPEQYNDNSQTGGLVDFDGSQLKGKWRLIVTDTEDIGAGSLKCFTLTAKTK